MLSSGQPPAPIPCPAWPAPRTEVRDVCDEEVAALGDHGPQAHTLHTSYHVVTSALHGLRELHKVAAGLAEVELLPLQALGYCGLGGGGVGDGQQVRLS